jgi:hypothetical protein
MLRADVRAARMAFKRANPIDLWAGMTAKIAYKVFTGDEWAALSAGAFEGSPTDKADGFIHLSTAEQLTETFVTALTHKSIQLIDSPIGVTPTGNPYAFVTAGDGTLWVNYYAAGSTWPWET